MEIALAQFVQDVFRLVSQAIDLGQAQKAGRPLEGMHGAENGVQEAEIVRLLFQKQQVRLNGFQVFFGFDDEVAKDFRVQKLLAHACVSLGY